MSLPVPNFSFLRSTGDLNSENTPPPSPDKSLKRKASQISASILSNSPAYDSSGFSSDEEPVLALSTRKIRLTEPTQHFSFPETTRPNLHITQENYKTIGDALLEGFDPAYRDMVLGEFDVLLTACWQALGPDLPYSNTYPLFLEKSSQGFTNAMILKENVFCLLGKRLGKGCQSVVKRGVLIRYDESEGFKLDPEHPTVVIAHASPAELKRIRNSKTVLRYSESVTALLNELGEHTNIVPKPLYIYTNPQKVMERANHRGITLGQVSIEPIKFDGSSDNHKFASVAEIKMRAQHIAQGLKHIHDHHSIHRDLKSDNIFIEGNNTRIGDLELLIKEDQKDTSGRVIPTLGHIMKIKNQAHERMAFGYLIKEWLGQYLKQQPMARSESKKEAPLMPLPFFPNSSMEKPAFIKRSEAGKYTFDDKDAWLSLYDFANSLTHNSQNLPRSTKSHNLEAPISLNQIIELLTN